MREALFFTWHVAARWRTAPGRPLKHGAVPDGAAATAQAVWVRHLAGHRSLARAVTPLRTRPNYVRNAWLLAYVRELQLLAIASLVPPSSAERKLIIRQFLISAPQPATTAERMLATLMIKGAGISFDIVGFEGAFARPSNTQGPAAKGEARSRCDAHAIRQFIDHHTAQHLTCQSLAIHFHLNRDRVNLYFRSTFGSSVRSYLEKRRVSQAAALLKQTEIKVEVVAMMVGYRSKKDFYHAFRRQMDCTPGEFRRTITKSIS